MTLFKRTTDHPFLKALSAQYLAKDNERYYQPTDADWPLYSIHIIRVGDFGISLNMSVKTAEDSFWQELSTFYPLPYDLVLVLGSMILGCMDKVTNEHLCD